MLVLERAYATGVGNSLRLYDIDTRDASDTLALDTLTPGNHRPAPKRLVADFATSGLSRLDNTEGLCWGPRSARRPSHAGGRERRQFQSAADHPVRSLRIHRISHEHRRHLPAPHGTDTAAAGRLHRRRQHGQRHHRRADQAGHARGRLRGGRALRAKRARGWRTSSASSRRRKPARRWRAATVVVWAVKPQTFADAASAGARPGAGRAAPERRRGHPVATASPRWLGTERVVRAMPNTPALVGQGMTGLFARAAVDGRRPQAASSRCWRHRRTAVGRCRRARSTRSRRCPAPARPTSSISSRP